MPPARSTAARTRTAPRPEPPAGRAQGFQPRRVRSRAPLSRIRWDRASRIALVAVLMLIAYLWISGITSLLRTHSQAERGLAQVHRLAAQNQRLLNQQKALHQPATILEKARGLGMVKQGEQAFIVTH